MRSRFGPTHVALAGLALLAWGGVTRLPAHARDSRSIEANKALVRRVFEEILSKGNLALIDELVASDYVAHGVGGPEGLRGRESLKQFVAATRAAFPDVVFTVEDQIAERDEVVTRYTMRGTQQGKWGELPPTGKSVTITGMHISRIAGGKVVESWTNSDTLGLMRQLGALPAPQPR